MDTSGSTSFSGQAGSAANAGAAYSGDPNAAGDYANGKATIDSTYASSNQDLNQMNASCAAILSGLAVLNDPNASAGDKLKATLTIDAGIAGTAVFAAAALTAGGALGLFAAGAALATIPVIGAIAVVAVTIAGIVLTAFNITIPVAHGQPITWSSSDLAYNTIGKIWTAIPLISPPKAPFTNSSRQLASLLASYVQAERAQAGLPTLAMLSTPQRGQFGYQTVSADTIHLEIAGFLGGQGALASQVESIVSVLWDPRWPADQMPETIYGGQDLIGTGDEIDSQNPQGMPVQSLDPITRQVLATSTDRKGLSAASRLIELAAALFLANDPNAPGSAYAMVFLYLTQVSWVYKTTNMPVPDSLYAATGFMLECAVDNSIPLLSVIGGTKTAVKPVGSAAFSALHLEGNSPIDVWVSYYLSRANEVAAS